MKKTKEEFAIIGRNVCSKSGGRRECKERVSKEDCKKCEIMIGEAQCYSKKEYVRILCDPEEFRKFSLQAFEEAKSIKVEPVNPRKPTIEDWQRAAILRHHVAEAFEFILKAIIIKHTDVVNEEELLNKPENKLGIPKDLKTHNLTKLLLTCGRNEKLKERLEMLQKYSYGDLDAIKELTEYNTWKGRYPIPTKFEAFNSREFITNDMIGNYKHIYDSLKNILNTDEL